MNVPQWNKSQNQSCFGAYTVVSCVLFPPYIWVQTQKKLFLAKFCLDFLPFLSCFELLSRKRWKSLFQPAFGVPSTQMLVKIYNKWISSGMSPYKWLINNKLSSYPLLNWKKGELNEILWVALGAVR